MFFVQFVTPQPVIMSDNNDNNNNNNTPLPPSPPPVENNNDDDEVGNKRARLDDDLPPLPPDLSFLPPLLPDLPPPPVEPPPPIPENDYGGGWSGGGSGGSMGGEKEEEDEPISLQEAHRVHNKRIQVERKNCFGCLYGFYKDADVTADPHMAELLTIFNAYQTGLTRKELLQMISEAHNRLYIESFKKQKKVSPYKPWTVEQIDAHIEDHAFFDDFQVQKDIRSLTALCDVLEQSMIRKKKNSTETNANKVMVELYLKTMGQKQSTMRQYAKDRAQ